MYLEEVCPLLMMQLFALGVLPGGAFLKSLMLLHRSYVSILGVLTAM